MHGGTDGGLPRGTAVGFAVTVQLVKYPPVAGLADLGRADALLQRTRVPGDAVADDPEVQVLDGRHAPIAFCVER